MPDWIRNWSAHIQAQLTHLTASQKMLIGSLMIIVAFSLWLVLMYAGTAQMVPMLDQPLEAAAQTRIVNYLEQRRIPYEVSGDRVLVPVEHRLLAIGALEEQKLLPDDTSRGFAALVLENQTWWRPNEQNRQMMLIATQEVLAKVIGAYPWVSNATVIISRPQQERFGSSHQSPTASVNVVTRGEQLNQRQVDAIAGLVSGAVAEMKPQNVTVIDAIAGRQWTVRPEGEQIPTDHLELIHKAEAYHREKITAALSYINKVIVAVSVEVDMTRGKSESTTYNREGTVEALKREHSRTTSTTDPSPGGEPGARSNTGADIAGATNAGHTSTTEESETEFDPRVGVTHKVEAKSGGAPKKINATVNIPRSFFVALFKRGQPADAPDPTDAAMQPLIDGHVAKIKQQVEALVATTEQPGSVVVDVYPDAPLGPADGAGALAASGGGLLAMDDGIVKVGSLGALAVLALGFMFMLLRSASKRPAPPNPRELAGVPPVLAHDDDLVGEAGEMAAALAGVEVGDEQVRQQQIIGQVGDLVRANPEQVAQIIGRWVRKTQ